MAEIKVQVFGKVYQERTKGFTTGAECSLCGKKTGNGKKTFAIHYTTNGTITDQAEHPESQGCFPIGRECAKTLPKAFIFASGVI